MVPTSFLYPMEWDQIAAAQRKNRQYLKSYQWNEGRELTNIWWNEFSDAQAPHCAQGFLDITTSWSSDVHAMKCCQAQP